MPDLFQRRLNPVRDPTFHRRIDDALRDRLNDIKRKDFADTLWIGETKFIVEGPQDYFPHAEQSYDLIVINGGLHVINDLPGALIQIRRALKPDGLFLCALIGGETLHELRDSLTRVEVKLRGGASPRIHPMIDLQTMAGLMQRAGFALPVVDSEIETIFYKNLKTLLKDIKNAGEGLALLSRNKKFVGRDFWNDVENDYKIHHADDDGLLKASIEIIYAIGWGPSHAQQQPLKPGSAKHRLADALDSTEQPLPDSAKP